MNQKNVILYNPPSTLGIHGKHKIAQIRKKKKVKLKKEYQI